MQSPALAPAFEFGTLLLRYLREDFTTKMVNNDANAKQVGGDVLASRGRTCAGLGRGGEVAEMRIRSVLRASIRTLSTGAGATSPI
jgi:hypothetical protein